MCRGSSLGPCCAQGCDERISCQDTGGYCNGHDPLADLSWDPVDEDAPEVEDRPPVVDDVWKRRTYDLGRLASGIKTAELEIQSTQARLAKMRQRVADLTGAG